MGLLYIFRCDIENHHILKIKTKYTLEFPILSVEKKLVLAYEHTVVELRQTHLSNQLYQNIREHDRCIARYHT